MRELGTARASRACRVCRGTVPARRHARLGGLEAGEGTRIWGVSPLGALEAGRARAPRGGGRGARGCPPPGGCPPVGDRQGRWQALGRVRAARACGRSGTAERAERWGQCGRKTRYC